jgi:hypothetical protein
MVYEVHFYSSGALEEDWTTKDLKENFMVASFGSILGSLLTVALMAVAALVLYPRGIFPELLSTTILAGAFPWERTHSSSLYSEVLPAWEAPRSRPLCLAPTTSASSSIWPGVRIGP